MKNTAVDLSIANLCFLKAWVLVLYSGDQAGYYFSGHPLPAYLAIIADILILTLIFYFLRIISTSIDTTFVRLLRNAVLLVSSGLAINGFRAALKNSQQFLAIPGILLAIASLSLFLLTGYLLIWRREKAAPFFRSVAMVFLPLLFIFMVQAAMVSARWQPPPPFRYKSGTSDSKPTTVSGKKQPHIVWIIFDEMDQRIAFSERPAGLALPEFDRFRSEGFSADNALPPAKVTLLALPDLISGRIFDKAVPTKTNDLLLKVSGTDERGFWSAFPSIFSRFSQLGLESQAIGFYHPYERVFAANLINGSSFPLSVFNDTRNYGLAGNMIQMCILLFDSQTFNYQTVTQHTSLFRDIHRHAKAEITKPVALTFLHYPIPHPPYIFDRTANNFSGSVTRQSHGRYLDNLVLADNTLGELRNVLESAGMWEASTIVISSDHPWRFSKAYDGKAGQNVPFLVKLAGRNDRAVYDRPFNTVVTQDMIVNIAEGNISTHDQISAWLDRKAVQAIPSTGR